MCCFGFIVYTLVTVYERLVIFPYMEFSFRLCSNVTDLGPNFWFGIPRQLFRIFVGSFQLLTPMLILVMRFSGVVGIEWCSIQVGRCPRRKVLHGGR
jgi:hypothetical protein